MTLLMGLPIVPYVKVAITHVTNAMITGLKTVCSVVKILLIIGTCTQIKITNVYAKQITMMMERIFFAKIVTLPVFLVASNLPFALVVIKTIIDL